MDNNKKQAIGFRVERTIEALKKNNFNALYASSREEALSLVKSMIKENSKTASGGSMTLSETGILDYLKEHTRYTSVAREAYSADFYLASCNAITEHGEIYNVDGRSNRTSAILYGPDKVILVAGANKIVTNLRSAVERVKTQASPANAIRLERNTPCARTGICVHSECSEENLFSPGCTGQDRICCNAVMMGQQSAAVKGRITVIIVGDYLGY